MKTRVLIDNHMMGTMFFMLFLLFFGLTVWQITQTKFINTITVIMIFICLIISIGFKTWGIIRDVEAKIDVTFIKGL